VAVYFRGERLATADGHSIQQAEMNAAKKALMNSQCMFYLFGKKKIVLIIEIFSSISSNQSSENGATKNYQQKEAASVQRERGRRSAK